MSFWYYMLASVTLLPLTMIGMGSYFSNHVPKKINTIYGYRTARSMKNRETWEFAHHHSGRLWRVLGCVMLPLSVAPLFFVIGKDEGTLSIMGLVILGIQVLALLGSIFPTELALKKRFDEDGNRRE